ncbi:unnamed protein product [Periconia digitata]|uniref:Uncharacterized protein n=1 Tax=Periconia digitata TaxID=1303443 RepID=A0A9W4UAF3_9PLEO|nr:unnamed protein product [Periconia digitata]
MVSSLIPTVRRACHSRPKQRRSRQENLYMRLGDEALRQSQYPGISLYQDSVGWPVCAPPSTKKPAAVTSTHRKLQQKYRVQYSRPGTWVKATPSADGHMSISTTTVYVHCGPIALYAWIFRCYTKNLRSRDFVPH